MKPGILVGGALLGLATVTSVALVATGLPALDRGDGLDRATVLRVVDGDTVQVDLAGAKKTVRLLNVDAPETKHPDRPVGCLGPEASKFLTRLLPPGTGVELEYDGARLDRYSRTLAGVWLKDELVNAEVARAGLGSPVQYNGQVKFLAAVEEAAEEARERKRGAFGDDVSCSLPSKVTRALATMQKVDDPAEKTSAGYSATIASLSSAKTSADKVAAAASKERERGGAGSSALYEAVRATQLGRLARGTRAAERRLTNLRATRSELRKQEADAREKRERKRAEEKRERERVRAEQERKRALERAEQRRQRELKRVEEERQQKRERQAAKAAEREREQQRLKRQQDEDEGSSKQNEDGGSSGASVNEGYTGNRCYAPGGRTWRPC